MQVMENIDFNHPEQTDILKIGLMMFRAEFYFETQLQNDANDLSLDPWLLKRNNERNLDMIEVCHEVMKVLVGLKKAKPDDQNYKLLLDGLNAGIEVINYYIKDEGSNEINKEEFDAWLNMHYSN